MSIKIDKTLLVTENVTYVGGIEMKKILRMWVKLTLIIIHS